jgi:hypothetical protein
VWDYSLSLSPVSYTTNHEKQTAFDAANYALGNTDKFRGTGVWSGIINVEREPKVEEEINAETTSETSVNQKKIVTTTTASKPKSQRPPTKTGGKGQSK